MDQVKQMATMEEEEEEEEEVKCQSAAAAGRARTAVAFRVTARKDRILVAIAIGASRISFARRVPVLRANLARTSQATIFDGVLMVDHEVLRFDVPLT